MVVYWSEADIERPLFRTEIAGVTAILILQYCQTAGSCQYPAAEYRSRTLP